MNSHILPALALMIAVGVFFAYVNPVWSGPIAATKAAIASDVKALAAAKEYTAKENELARARDDIDPANLERLETFLPDSIDNVGLIVDINALAARSGLSISDVDVARSDARGVQSSSAGLSSSQASPVGSVDLSLSAIGTYKALQTFLVGIEKSARLLDVRSIAVESSNTGVYSYDMTVRLYWLR